MNDVSQTPETLFGEAIEIPSRQDRSLFLDRACQGNTELRREVEKLVEDYFRAGNFLESPALEVQRTAPIQSIAEGPGSIIGPYKLLQQIGEGGMGVVFMAEQTEPIQRIVALKIIKPGMDTRQVIARFEAERQALAMMDHPNIAKVLDAGTTGGSRDEGLGSRASSSTPSLALDSRLSTLDHSSGRPYFVMDLVKGVPITDYCDCERLSVRQRLELFTQVCHAVQHAHQKGIIHRDLKPSNVLVAEYDGKPVPKVIDFGVAKATAQRLTERTMFTEYGQLIGTFEYMSPEQARFNQLDVDTRSDIYSLGVLLYELLTGTTPLERKRLETVAFDETLRIIREEEPPRPSTRVSTLSLRSKTRRGEERAGVRASPDPVSIAANRDTEPAKLTKEMHGELDWITMKCLEKDRNRRYETASALAADIQHFLNDEPVSAVAPSRLYRTSKFVRRNKLVVIASTAVLLGLVAGIIGMAVGLVSQSRLLAVAERQRAESQLNLANSLQSQRRYAEAEALLREGLESPSGTKAEDRQQAARTRLGLAKVVYDRGNAKEAEQLHREALAAFRESFPPGDSNIAHALTTFALFLRAHHRYAEAEPLFREAYEIHRTAPQADHFSTGVSATYLGSVLNPLGRYAEAEPVLRNGIAEHRLAEPTDDWALAITQVELGRNLVMVGKFAEAESQLVEAERVLASTEEYRQGMFALVALYTAWDRSVPNQGYDIKAQEWLRKLIETFVRLDEAPADGSKVPTK